MPRSNARPPRSDNRPPDSNARPSLWCGLVRLALAVVLAGLGYALARALAALGRARNRARDVPLSPLTGGWRVGADYPERRGIVADGTVAGEMDDLSAFAGPTFDPEAVAPDVRDFYERTADYALAYDVCWHPPFRLGAALASGMTSRIEQLNLPGPGDSGSERADGSHIRELESRFVRVDPAADPREGARAWVRTRADGEGETAVFVAIYAHHEGEATTDGRDGTTSGRDRTTAEGQRTRYVNIAVPLPGANLSTVLRPENPADGSGGIELTTFGDSGGGDAGDGSDDRNGDEGLYLVTPLGAFDLPLDQRFRVRPADAREGDLRSDSTGGGAAVVATHEMWVFGRQFLTIRYAARVDD